MRIVGYTRGLGPIPMNALPYTEKAVLIQSLCSPAAPASGHAMGKCQRMANAMTFMFGRKGTTEVMKGEKCSRLGIALHSFLWSVLASPGMFFSVEASVDVMLSSALKNVLIFWSAESAGSATAAAAVAVDVAA